MIQVTTETNVNRLNRGRALRQGLVKAVGFKAKGINNCSHPVIKQIWYELTGNQQAVYLYLTKILVNALRRTNQEDR